MKQFLKFLTKLRGFWKIYSGYGYDGDTVEFIIDNYINVLENRTHAMSKPTYHAKDVINELDNYYNSIKKDGDKIFINYNMRRKEYALEQIETIVRAHEDMQYCKEHAGEHLHSEEYLKIIQLRQQIEYWKGINAEKDLFIKELKIKLDESDAGEHSLCEEIEKLEAEKRKNRDKMFPYESIEKMKEKIAALNGRHQSDCIEKTQLHTALDVMTEKYQRLREIHGL